jgi:hypothetical protein
MDRHGLALGFDAEPRHFGQLPQAAVETARDPTRPEPAVRDDDPRDVDDALGDWPTRARARKLLLPALRAGGAQGHQRTDETARPPGRADRRAQIHEALVVVTGRDRRDRLGGDGVQATLPGRRGGVLEGVHARQHPRDVAVDDREPMTEGDRPDRAGGVGTDAGQGADVRRRSGKRPPCSLTMVLAAACRARARA